MAAIGADHKPRAMLSDLSGRAIQWNDRTTKGLNARVRDNVSNKGPPATKLVIERVGKFVRGFSYGGQSTRAQLVYVLEASNTKASSRDLMRLEELLKQFQMDALILQFGHYPKGDALQLVTGQRRQFKHLQFVKVDIIRAYDDIYFDGAFGFAVRHVAKQAQRRRKHEKTLLAAKPTQVEPEKAKIPKPKQKPKAAKRQQAGLRKNTENSQRPSDRPVPYKASDQREKSKKTSGQPGDPVTSLLKMFFEAPPPNQDQNQDDMDNR